MSRELNVLLVEDNPADAELILRELRRGGFQPKWVRVDNEQDYLKRLDDDWEIILSDFALPQFDGPRALELLNESGRKLPFIIISGTIGEDIAVSVMRQGAADYLMKDRLTRLPQAVTQALDQDRHRKAIIAAEEELKASEQRFRQVVENIEEVFWMMDLKTNSMLFVSPAYEKIWGRSCESLFADPKSWLNAVHPDDKGPVLQAYFTQQNQEKFEQQYRIIRPDGSVRWIHVRGFKIREESGEQSRVAGVAQDITERKLAEDAVAARLRVEERLSKLAATAPGAIYTYQIREDGTPCFPYASPKIEDILGFPAEVLAKDASCVFERIHADDLGFLNRSIEQAMNTATPWHAVFRFLHPTKAYIWVEGHAVPEVLEDGTLLFHGFLLDVTERKNTEAVRLEQQHRLAGIISSAMDGIITVDERNRVVLFNPAAERMFQCAGGSALGRPLDRFIPGPLPATAEKDSGKNQPPSVVGVRRDGSQFPLEASIASVEVDGQKFLTITCRDVTERIKAEETRSTLEAQLRQSQKMEAIGTLAGGIAHDFNNILSAILGNVHLIKMDEPATPQMQESLEEIEKASLRAKNLVQQILSFSRQQVAERSIISLGPVVEEAAALMRATLPAGVKLTKSVAANAPNVLADSTQMHQVFVNLCTNAWHAMDDHPGRIEISLSSVMLDADEARELSGLRPGRYACVSVSDTGKGMDKQTLEQIFDPFFTTKEPGKGTGLGLSVVHGIIHSHDGAIRVTSQPGVGTTFHLYFPSVEAEIEAPEEIKTHLRFGNGERILFIDDEKALVFMAARLLKHLKYEISGYTQPEEAIEAFRANPESFDVVITDMNMPSSSGIKVAEELIKIRPTIPVILSSGYINENLIERAKRAGIRQLLYKPSPLEEISESIHQLLHTAQ